MSRSYKKTPYLGDRKSKLKNISNSKIRMCLKDPNFIIPKHAGYKKIHESWDICDFGCVYSWKEYWKRCVEYCNTYGEEYPDKQKEYQRWCKFYKRK